MYCNYIKNFRLYLVVNFAVKCYKGIGILKMYVDNVFIFKKGDLKAVLSIFIIY